MADFFVRDTDDDQSAESWTEAGGGTVYYSIYHAINTGGMGASDTCYIASDHDGTEGGEVTIPDSCQVLSVSVSDKDTLESGAICKLTSAYDLWGGKDIFVYGITFGNSANNNRRLVLLDDNVTFKKCTFHFDTGDRIYSLGTRSFFEDCTFERGEDQYFIDASQYFNMTFENCTFDVDATGGGLVDAHATDQIITMRNCTISNNSGSFIFYNVTTDHVRAHGSVKLIGCDLPASYTLRNESVTETLGWSEVECIGCGNYYGYEKENPSGSVSHNTTVYRDADAFDSTTGFSWHFEPSAQCDDRNYFLDHVIWAKAVDTDGFTNTITVTIHGIRDNSTNDPSADELRLFCSYVDGADDGLRVVVSTAMQADLDDDSGESGWTDSSLGTEGTDFVRFKEVFTLTIGSSAGNIQSGVLQVRAELYEANADYYLCPAVDLT